MKASAALRQLSSRTPTRSPGRRPMDNSPLASRRPRSHASLNVNRSPPWTTASRLALKVADRRMSPRTSIGMFLLVSLSDSQVQGRHLLVGQGRGVPAFDDPALLHDVGAIGDRQRLRRVLL